MPQRPLEVSVRLLDPVRDQILPGTLAGPPADGCNGFSDKADEISSGSLRIWSAARDSRRLPPGRPAARRTPAAGRTPPGWRRGRCSVRPRQLQIHRRMHEKDITSVVFYLWSRSPAVLLI